MYPVELITPMKNELTSNGFSDLTSSEEVDQFIQGEGTTLVVVNSVCGCAAGSARPGVMQALSKTKKRPSKLGTVFAGVDKEATEKAREHMLPYPPSSPSIALFRDGELVHLVERHHIEGNSAETIAEHLIGVFEEFC